MDSEIKDIIIALIEANRVYIGNNNKETGQMIAELYNSIKENIIEEAEKNKTPTEFEYRFREPKK